MYEAPKLIRVGKAQDVVLGTVFQGGDLDGMYTIPDMEFAEESLPED